MVLFKNILCVLLLSNWSSLLIAAPIDPNTLPEVDWTFQSLTFKATNHVYTPFFIDGDDFVAFTAGDGTAAGNGLFRLNTNLSGTKAMTQTMVIVTGPDITHYNYFRAARVAKNASELWMVVEVSGCYTGCATAVFPNRLAVYHSLDDGYHWTFLNFVSVDGTIYSSQWFAHTGLIYNPSGSATLDLVNLTKNRFVTVGENRNIFVSADGINYSSVPMNHPFPKDRLVFAALAKTPYGYHLTSCANWSDTYNTTTVRHLFSKDLKNWVAIESNSFLKHPTFYKGVHLSYEESTQRLWALSPCGSFEGCSFLAWMNPKNFLDPKLKTPMTETLPVGEFVHINDQTAIVTSRSPSSSGDLYTLRLANGGFATNLKKEDLVLPLSGYKRQGCTQSFCVGDAVYMNANLATIMGYYDKDPLNIKYALKFTSNGSVDTGYSAKMLTAP